LIRRALIPPRRFGRGYGSPEGCRGLEPAAPSGRNRQAERRESQGALARLCELPEKSEFPPHPSGPSAARNLLRSIKITLKKYSGIVIVAFGARETRIVAAYCRSLRFPTLRLPVSPTGRGRLRSLSDSCFSSIGLRWGFHPQPPDKGFHPLTLLRFAAA